MERSAELERLAERAHFWSTRVPDADTTSRTYTQFSLLLLPTRPPLIAWPDLELALETCFGSCLAVDMEQIKGGELGLELVVLALERADPSTMGGGAEEKWEDWISALKLAAGEQARRHPWHSRESAPELDDERKVPVENLRAFAQRMATPAPSNSRQSPSPSLEVGVARAVSEEKVQVEPSPLLEEPAEDNESEASSRRGSPSPELSVESEREESVEIVLKSRMPSTTLSPVSSPMVISRAAPGRVRTTSPRPARRRSPSTSPKRSSSPSPSPVVRKKSTRSTRSASISSSIVSKRPRKAAEPDLSSTPSLCAISLPSSSLPSTTPGWIELISRALESLPIGTGSIHEIIQTIKSLHPSAKLSKKVEERVSQVLDNYMCFDCAEEFVSGRRYQDKDLTMWSLNEQWRESALRGKAIKWEAAWAKDDGKELWCICRKPYGGRDMLICAGSECRIQWFHDDCVGEPSEMWDPSIEWKCAECSTSASKGKGKARPETTTTYGGSSKRGRDGRFVKTG